ncbi:uncharacterized protein IAS62_002223 [Cryptococcus decagattii]|uniref:Afadin and alpha-actinin-binding-domain-containing protein n=1 Tax=Cryptococcus decagattii TaxID=1859122 RepID=A0ABZ2ARB7_9TREE
MSRLGEPSRAVHYPDQSVAGTNEADPDSSTATVLSAELTTINSQLMSHGWAKRPLNLGALGHRDYNEVVAVLFELMGASVSNLNMLDTLNGRHRTLEYEYERLQKTTNSLKASNARLESEVSGWKSKCADIEKRLALEEIKTKELREENSRGRKALETVRVAATHETKKVQMSLDKAHAQLAKMGSDPTIANRPQGLILLNPIPAGRMRPVAASQSPLLEQTLRDLSDIRGSLQEETEAFRHVVVSTGNALREALAASRGQEPPTRLLQSQFFSPLNTQAPRTPRSSIVQSASSMSHPSIANVRLQSLIEQIRNRITEGVPQYNANGEHLAKQPTPEEIEEQNRIEREKEKKQRNLEDRIKDLEVELDCAKKKEEEASRVVADYAKRQVQRELNVDGSKEDMDMEIQKQALDKERKRYAEEAVKLRQERQQLEMERQTFLEEKRRAEEEAARAPANPPFTATIAEPALVHETEAQEDIPASSSSSTWHHHRPHSPSPLSPQHPKIRTPRAHMAGGKRKPAKTPLSRLVLEKADLMRGSVLGVEKGRKTNVGLSGGSPRKGKERERTIDGMRGSVMRNSTLGKSHSSSGSEASSGSGSKGITPAGKPVINTRPAGGIETPEATSSTMRTSTGTAGASQRKVMESNSIGAKMMVKKAAWR